jgi:hypothetical protein
MYGRTHLRPLPKTPERRFGARCILAAANPVDGS